MKNLKCLKKTFFLFFYFLCFEGITTTALAQSAGDQLGRLLEHLQTFQANFSQNIQDKSGHIFSQSEGKMALKRPGLFRWETQKPNQQLIIADGNTIWIYDKDLAQVTRQKQNAAANAPGLLLSDSVSQLIAQFNITFASGNTEKQPIFKLIPRGKKDLFQSVALMFDQSKLLKQMILQDNLGQITEIIFNQAIANPLLSSEVFRFHAPQDVEVVGK